MVGRILILSACLIGGSLATRPSNVEQIPARRAFAQFPDTIGGWRTAESSELDASTLATLGVDDYVNRLYANSGAYVGVYAAYYESQRQGNTMHSPLNCLPGAGWQPISRSELNIGLSDGSSIVVNRYIIQKGLDRQVVLYWYQSHGRVVSSEYAGKVYLVYDSIRLNRSDGGMVRVVSPIEAPTSVAETAASDRAVDFVKAAFPVLMSYLPS